MAEETKKSMDRRGFIVGAGLAGLGSAVAASGLAGVAAAAEGETSASAPVAIPKGAKVATRKFGKTGVDVSMLSMGGMYDIPGNQVMLRKCLDWGVTYWDTANGYGNGKSEEGIGMFFERFPETRKEVFLVTKSGKKDPAGMTELLNLSLQRMKTDHIDLYFMHGVGKPEELTPEMKAWAEKAKAEKKIKFFGFSTHGNMEALLSHAATLGWIDGIMLTYNHQVMDKDAMKAGIEACVKAGIGLTAMKTQTRGPKAGATGDKTMEAVERFIAKGLTLEQAKLKAVWQNKDIAAICSQMPNMTILTANVTAALDKGKLTVADFEALDSHSREVASAYCAGCSQICGAGACGGYPVAEVMRYMMYHCGYGETHMARQLFAALPAEFRGAMDRIDWSVAERACPQGLAISEIMQEARQVLA